jgi:hypothetical protein
MSKNSENEEFENNESGNTTNSNNNSGKQNIASRKKLLDVKETDIIDSDNNKSAELNNNSLLNFFSNDEEIEIEEKIVKEDHEIVYNDDTIYLNELENYFLSEYPIYKQSKRYIQDEALDKAKDVLEFKNSGVGIIKNKFKNNILKDYYHKIYNKKFIIPIVNDNKRTYKVLDGNDIILDDDMLNADINENIDEYVILNDQRIQFKKLKKLDESKLEFKEYLSEVNSLIKPYVINNGELESGIKIELEKVTQLLRQYNINTINWEKYVGLNGHSYNQNEINIDTGSFDCERKKLTKGEEVNIVGFLKLPTNTDNLYYKKNLDKFIEINNITNISFVKDKTLITIKQHYLEKGDIIFVNNSNSVPSIDGKHIINDVVSKDIIEIDLNYHDGTNGDRGDAYTLLVLSYRLHHIKKIINKWTTNTDKTIINKRENRPVADIYMIESVVDDDEYMAVLDEIIPSHTEIIEDEMDVLAKCINYNAVAKVLLKFNIDIQNLDIKDFAIIKKLLAKSMHDVKTAKKHDKKEKIKKIENEFITNTDFLYEDKYMKSDVIKKYYGGYPLFGSQYDNFRQRCRFIESQYDTGKLYYNYILSHTNKDSLRKCNIEKLKKGIKELKKELDIKTNKLENEKKLIDYIKKDNNDEYNSDNIKVEDLDIQKLQKYYFSNKCKNNTINRLEARIELLKSLHSKIETIIKFSDSSYYNNFYKTIILESEQELLRFIIKKDDTVPKLNSDDVSIKNTTKDSIKNINKIKNNKMTNIINRIYQEKDNNYKNYLLFKIIDKDGLLIDNYIYSKTYKCKILCGHWVYHKQIYNTNNFGERDKLTNTLYGLYGDAGKFTDNKETCKYCGNTLGDRALDSVEFNKQGKLSNPREVWSNEYDDINYMLKDKRINYYKDIGTDHFNKMMIDSGVKYSDLKIIEDISMIIKDISTKIGIELRNDDFLNCILDSYSNIIDIIRYDKYKIREIINLKSKGIEKEKIIEMDESKYFKKMYKRMYITQKISYIISRILLAIQVAIPDYKRKKTIIKCVFDSYDGEEGFHYMACVVESMKFFDEIFAKKDQDEKLDKIRKTIIYCYRIYTNQPKLKKQIFIKYRYIKDIEENKKIEPLQSMMFKKTHITIDKDFISTLKGAHDDNELKKLIGDYYAYRINISNNIQDIVNKYFLSKSNMGMDFIEEVGEGNNYYKSIKVENTDIIDLIKQSHHLENCEPAILMRGSYSRIVVNNKYKYKTIDTFPSIGNVTGDDIIKGVVSNYCYCGEYKGELHRFVGTDNNKTCIKCDKSIGDINKYEISEDEVGILLNTIENMNIVKKSIDIDTVKYKKTTTLDMNINKLYNNIKKYNTHEKVYTVEYLNNVGLYKKLYNIDNAKDDRGKIVIKQQLYNNGQEQLKIYINTYFRKYISMIKNGNILNKQTLKIDKTYPKIDKKKAIAKPDSEEKICTDIEKLLHSTMEEFHKFNENKTLFKLLEINETSDYIDTIDYESNKYDMKYKEVIYQSDFNEVDAYNLLLDLLFKNLNNFYKVVEKKLGEEYLKTLTVFITTVFNKIENDNTIVDMTSESSASVELSIDAKKSYESAKLASKDSAEQKQYKKIIGETIDGDDMDDNGDDITGAEAHDKIIDIAKESNGDIADVDIDGFKYDYIDNKNEEDNIEEDEELQDGSELMDEQNEYDDIDKL